MYAAAGGASLASRKARQAGQKKNLKNEKAKQLQSKATAAATTATLKPPQSKQFHNLQSSTLMLSRVERGTLKPPVAAVNRRHSSTLTHSSTNLRAKSPAPRIRESPSMLLPLQNHLAKGKSQPLSPTTLAQNHLPVSRSFALPQILIPESEPGKEHERRCSLVRQCEEAEKVDPEDLEKTLLIDLRDVGTDGNPLLYSELDKNFYGSLEYPMSEVWEPCTPFI